MGGRERGGGKGGEDGESSRRGGLVPERERDTQLSEAVADGWG